jgi:hypothetical protein
MLVLATVDAGNLSWISADRSGFVTRQGRVTRTFGLGPDLRETRDLESDPIASRHFDFALSSRRTIDVVEPLAFGVPVASTFEVVGRRTIAILDATHDTVLVRETGRAPLLRWTFENEFWLDFADGYVWKSVQHFSPLLPPLEIEVYKREVL